MERKDEYATATATATASFTFSQQTAKPISRSDPHFEQAKTLLGLSWLFLVKTGQRDDNHELVRSS
jgi:hypothetical protein